MQLLPSSSVDRRSAPAHPREEALRDAWRSAADDAAAAYAAWSDAAVRHRRTTYAVYLAAADREAAAARELRSALRRPARA